METRSAKRKKLLLPSNTKIKSMETRSAKRKKLLHAEYKLIDVVDRISDLPDAVLHQILVLLPVRSIAQTGVLSKRWRHIWYSFPDLDFTTVKSVGVQKSNPRRKGISFINQVLSLRGKHNDIRILRLRATLSFSQLNGLIRSAVRHNVQELDIEVDTIDYFNFPPSILKADSLRVLKLKSRNPGFRLPPSKIMKEGFLSLHTLSLSLVIMHKQECLLDLFTDSSFPRLKKLKLDMCLGLKHFRVSCRGLVEFTLENCFELDNLEICCPKLEGIIISNSFSSDYGYGCGSWVKIDAPKLKNIIWSDNCITDHIFLENLTSLREACVGFNWKGMTETRIPGISKFLYGLSHCQCLTLQSRCVQILSGHNHVAGDILQPFVNLKSLELTGNIEVLPRLFSSSCSLHTLILKQSHGSLSALFKSKSQEFMPLLHVLKIIKIHRISESEHHMNLLKFLLGHATVLQEMVISYLGLVSSRGSSLRRERIKSRVVGFSRASSDAKIVFQESFFKI